MNTAILLICVLVPILAASMFYVSDRRAAQQATQASPTLVGVDAEESDVDATDDPVADPDRL